MNSFVRIGTAGYVSVLFFLCSFAGCNEPSGIVVFEDTGNQASIAVFSTQDSGAVIVGDTPGDDGMSDITILRIDQIGQILWQRTINKGQYEIPIEAVESADRGYVVLGKTNSDGYELPYYLYKFDEFGNEIWDVSIGDSEDIFSGIVATDDGGFLVISNRAETYCSEVSLLKVNDTGETEWRYDYSLELSDVNVQRVAQTQDGGFVVVGSRLNRETSDLNGMLFKVDPDGELLWTVETGDPSIDDRFTAIASTVDGGVVAGGIRGITCMGASEDGEMQMTAWIAKVDADGNIEWDRLYGGDEEDSLVAIATTSDGGFVFSGSTRSFGRHSLFLPTWDAWIVKLDSAGNMEWHTQHPGNGNLANASDVHQRSDGSFVVTGSIQQGRSHSWHIYAMHLDENGKM